MNYKLFIYLKAQAAFWEETHAKEGEREMHKSCKEKICFLEGKVILGPIECSSLKSIFCPSQWTHEQILK